MKIGFSSLSCPAWNLETIMTQAAAMGFAGVELRGLGGELHLPLCPELSSHPEAVKRRLEEQHVELVCLGSSATLSTQDKRELAKQKGIIEEYLELAATLGCPYVRVFPGQAERFDTSRAALSRITDALLSLIPIASRLGVTILVENNGDFAGSADLWFLMDAVAHPSVQCCWNQCNAMTLRERPTISIPRLRSKIALAHLCDAKVDAAGVLGGYVPLGSGDVEVRQQIDLYKGVMFPGYLMFEWPKLWVPSLPAPEAALPQVAAFLKEAIEAKQPILSAYKGDKNAPKFAARATPATARSGE